MRHIKYLGILVTVALSATLFIGCASAPKETSGSSSKTVFKQPIEKVQKAAEDALASTGFDIDKSSLNYVEGSRPRKVGLVVGSGGERVGVWLESIGPNSTQVMVSTSRSFAGYAGQKNWNVDVIAEMEKTLGKGQ